MNEDKERFNGEPVEPGAEAGEPTADATEPGADAGEPTADASEPTADATEPAADAGEASADASEPTADASEQNADTAEPTAGEQIDGEPMIADIAELSDGAARKIPRAKRKRARREAKHKKPESLGKKIVLTLLALIPTAVTLFLIVFAAKMNALSFYGMPRRETVMLIAAFVMLGGSAALAFFRPRIPKAIGWIVWAVAPACIMLLSEWIRRDPFDGNFSAALIVFNMIIYYVTAAFLLFATRNTFVSAVAASVFPLVVATANYYVQTFRGTVLFPWDLQSLGIAMTVVDNYEFDFPFVLAFALICFVSLWQIAYFSRVKILRSPKKMTVSFVCAALCVALGVGYGKYVQSDRFESDFNSSGKGPLKEAFTPSFYPYWFTPNTIYNRDGMMVSLIYSLKYMSVEKPEGYGEQALADVAARYVGGEKTGDGTKPNVIVIMNEAWSDISAIAPFETNKEVFPVTSGLTENTVRGRMYMSVVGGNTANSEFEFLTSSSMAFLPPGSVAYQQFVKGETPSLVTSLVSQGYQTAAMHDYLAGGWERNKVYPWLGFESSYFQNDFPKNAERIRSYISDRAMFQMIERVFEARDKDKPFFLFGVTMQNHGSYSGHYDNFDPDVYIEGLEDRTQLTQYLSLIRETDIAFGEMIDYFTNVGEPTVILMFGDHQPGETVTAPLYANAGLEYPPQSFEDQQAKFIVPFIMWANYDIEEETDVLTSPNYLSVLLCEKAGLELTGYQKFLADLHEKYPVVTANFFIDENGAFRSSEEMAGEAGLNEYRIIQYNHIFDRDARYEKLFEISD